MTTENKTCKNMCASCNCSCVGTEGHSCTKCDVCTQKDDHTRKPK